MKKQFETEVPSERLQENSPISRKASYAACAFVLTIAAIVSAMQAWPSWISYCAALGCAAVAAWLITRQMALNANDAQASKDEMARLIASSTEAQQKTSQHLGELLSQVLLNVQQSVTATESARAAVEPAAEAFLAATETFSRSASDMRESIGTLQSTAVDSIREGSDQISAIAQYLEHLHEIQLAWREQYIENHDGVVQMTEAAFSTLNDHLEAVGQSSREGAGQLLRAVEQMAKDEQTAVDRIHKTMSDESASLMSYIKANVQLGPVKEHLEQVNSSLETMRVQRAQDHERNAQMMEAAFSTLNDRIEAVGQSGREGAERLLQAVQQMAKDDQTAMDRIQKTMSDGSASLMSYIKANVQLGPVKEHLEQVNSSLETMRVQRAQDHERNAQMTEAAFSTLNDRLEAVGQSSREGAERLLQAVQQMAKDDQAAMDRIQKTMSDGSASLVDYMQANVRLTPVEEYLEQVNDVLISMYDQHAQDSERTTQMTQAAVHEINDHLQTINQGGRQAAQQLAETVQRASTNGQRAIEDLQKTVTEDNKLMTDELTDVIQFGTDSADARERDTRRLFEEQFAGLSSEQMIVADELGNLKKILRENKSSIQNMAQEIQATVSIMERMHALLQEQITAATSTAQMYEEMTQKDLELLRSILQGPQDKKRK